MNKSIQEPISYSVSIFLLFWLFFISFTLSAQENDKYIMLKSLSWDELQLYQLDSLKSATELSLADHCPSTLKKLQSSYNKTGTHVQYIFGTQYIWTEFTNSDEKLCLVKHSRIGSISANDNKIINPNEYELLNSTQSRILKSASKGYGLKEKGYYEKVKQANLHNQKIQNIPYEKYGGMNNLVNYMSKHKPSYKLDDSYKKSLTKTEDNTVISKKIPLYRLFELKYSAEQQQELIESVKKN